MLFPLVLTTFMQYTDPIAQYLDLLGTMFSTRQQQQQQQQHLLQRSVALFSQLPRRVYHLVTEISAGSSQVALSNA